jgi:hypothetical protein
MAAAKEPVVATRSPPSNTAIDRSRSSPVARLSSFSGGYRLPKAAPWQAA